MSICLLLVTLLCPVHFPLKVLVDIRESGSYLTGHNVIGIPGWLGEIEVHSGVEPVIGEE